MQVFWLSVAAATLVEVNDLAGESEMHASSMVADKFTVVTKHSLQSLLNALSAPQMGLLSSRARSHGAQEWTLPDRVSNVGVGDITFQVSDVVAMFTLGPDIYTQNGPPKPASDFNQNLFLGTQDSDLAVVHLLLRLRDTPGARKVIFSLRLFDGTSLAAAPQKTADGGVQRQEAGYVRCIPVSDVAALAAWDAADLAHEPVNTWAAVMSKLAPGIAKGWFTQWRRHSQDEAHYAVLTGLEGALRHVAQRGQIAPPAPQQRAGVRRDETTGSTRASHARASQRESTRPRTERALAAEAQRKTARRARNPYGVSSPYWDTNEYDRRGSMHNVYWDTNDFDKKGKLYKLHDIFLELPEDVEVVD